MIRSVRSYLCCLPTRRNMSCLPTSGWVMHFALLNKHTYIFICADTHTEFQHIHLLWKTPPLMQTLSHASTPMQNAFPNMSLSLLSFFISPPFISHIHVGFSCPLTFINRGTRCSASSLMVNDCLAGETLLCRGRETAKYQHVTNMRGPAGSHKHVLTAQKIRSCPNKLRHTSNPSPSFCECLCNRGPSILWIIARNILRVLTFSSSSSSWSQYWFLGSTFSTESCCREIITVCNVVLLKWGSH